MMNVDKIMLGTKGIVFLLLDINVEIKIPKNPINAIKNGHKSLEMMKDEPKTTT